MQRARLPESACCMSRHLPSSFVSLRSLADAIAPDQVDAVDL
ncbi:hypothetical protein K3Z86_29650, partial [Pseudomonas aeruginosa]|nr:hypothetical protein [Pseudomonas aeruginosa]